MQTYKNLGDSSKKAAGKVLVNQLIKGVVASVAVGALTYQITKSDAFQYAQKIVGG